MSGFEKETNQDVVVIIRAAYERTENLCLDLIKEQVAAERVVVLHERPFGVALRRSLEIGLEFGLTWTLCIDADVLIKPNAIQELLSFAITQPEYTLGASGLILDKLRGGQRRGGLHLYRTAMLPEALSVNPDAFLEKRPETAVKTALYHRGHPLGLMNLPLAIHDFEQYYTDIFRKMTVRAQKSSQEIEPMLKRALFLARDDADFLVAAWGMRIGLNSTKEITLDARLWENEAKALLCAHDMQEKAALDIAEGRKTIQPIISNLNSSIPNQEYTLSQFSEQKAGRSNLRSFFLFNTWRFGGWLNRMGSRLQKAAYERMPAKQT